MTTGLQWDKDIHYNQCYCTADGQDKKMRSMAKLTRRQFSAMLFSAPLFSADLHDPYLAGQTRKDWTEQRHSILSKMELVMGPFPKEKARPPLDMRVLGSADTTEVSRLKISYASEKGDRTPGYLLKPKRLEGRVPGILCLMPTTVVGAAEPAGLGGKHDLPGRDYALELAERGYVTLAPDYPGLPFPFSTGFGGYRYDSYRHGYKSQTMKGIWNHRRAVDLLQSMPEVDPERIGCIGHSLGGHNTLFVGAFDPRIRVLVCSCGFTSWRAYGGGDLSAWAQLVYMPLIALQYHNDPSEMTFPFSDVLASLAPRPLFINAPLHDAIFPVAGVREVIKVVRPLYSKRFNAGSRLVVRHPDAPHSFPHAVRMEAYQFINKWLREKPLPRS